MDILKLKCKVCGTEFEAKSKRKMYCETCLHAINNVRAMLRKRGASYTLEECIEVCRNRIARGLDPTRQGKGEVVRCKYCGKDTTSATGFCTTCRHEGYDDIFRVTGRSNGWETERAHGHCARGGWRGQRIMGGGAATWFPGRMDWLGR